MLLPISLFILLLHLESFDFKVGKISKEYKANMKTFYIFDGKLKVHDK